MISISRTNGKERKQEHLLKFWYTLKIQLKRVTFFKLSELRFLYESRLKDFGISKERNKVRFKEQILAHFTEAQAQSDGKNIILVFDKGMQQLLKQACKSNYESWYRPRRDRKL